MNQNTSRTPLQGAATQNAATAAHKEDPREAAAGADGEAGPDADVEAGPDADVEAGPSSPGPHSTLKPGDPVVALTINRGGAYGQVAVTNANLVAPLPPGMDPALAAAVPANTTTALVALERVAHLKPGEHVLVHAAAGGLGSQFGQIARLLGAARTVGVVGSEAKRGAALDLGYDEVWLRSELGDAAGGQFDVVVDPVAGPARQTSLDLLRLGGRLLAVGDAAQAGDPMVSSNSLWLRGVGVLGFNLGAFTAANPRTTGVYLRRALNLAASGEVAVHIAERAPIREAPRVLADMAAGATVGKAVLVHERER